MAKQAMPDVIIMTSPSQDMWYSHLRAIELAPVLSIAEEGNALPSMPRCRPFYALLIFDLCMPSCVVEPCVENYPGNDQPILSNI